MKNLATFPLASAVFCALALPGLAQPPMGTPGQPPAGPPPASPPQQGPPPNPGEFPATPPPGVSVSVPSGYVVPGVASGTYCVRGQTGPLYPGYGPNPTYPPIPGTAGAAGYYPAAGNTQIIVQVGMYNNLALGPNASAALGQNPTAVSGTQTNNALTVELLKKALDLHATAAARDTQSQADVKRLLEEIKNALPPKPGANPVVNDATAVRLLDLILEQNRAAGVRSDANNAAILEALKSLTKPAAAPTGTTDTTKKSAAPANPGTQPPTATPQPPAQQSPTPQAPAPKPAAAAPQSSAPGSSLEVTSTTKVQPAQPLEVTTTTKVQPAPAATPNPQPGVLQTAVPNVQPKLPSRIFIVP